MLLAALLLSSLSLSSSPPLAPRAWRDLKISLSDSGAIADVDAREAAEVLRSRGCGSAVLMVRTQDVAVARSFFGGTVPVLARGRTAAGQVCEAQVFVDVSWRRRAVFNVMR